jgi:nucleotide-binding universal stress UspA family protein
MMIMKTILLPTDFSKSSKNAIAYAVEIAKRSKAKLILLHTYSVPIVTTDVMVVPPIHEIERSAISSLKKMADTLHRAYGNKIAIDYKCMYGTPVESISEFCKKNKVDLIVMGMQGGGLLTEKLVGSTTTSVMRKVNCPVLCIDKSVRFKPTKKIVLACDLRFIPGAKTFRILKDYAALFKSNISVLYVMNEFETLPKKGEEKVGAKLKNALSDVKHTFNFVKNNDVVQAINDFAKKQKADMVVMIPHKHDVYENLFFEHDSKRMAFHTRLPLLTLLK